MPATEMLVRSPRTGGAPTYAVHEVECSSSGAPWRDLVRLERGRKLVAERELTVQWATIAVVRGESGILEQTVNRAPLHAVSLTVGSILVYPGSASIHAALAQPVHATCMQLAPRVLAAIAGQTGRPAELAASWRAADEQLELTAALLEAEARAGYPSGRLYGEHLAHALAAYLLQNYAAPRGADTGKARAAREKVAAALRYIQVNGAQDLSIEKLAGIAHLSPYHFSRLFKQTTGLTPHQYVLHRRIEEAKRLLGETRLDLVEIAERLGFRDQSHFTERFRRVTGATPKRWRHKA